MRNKKNQTQEYRIKKRTVNIIKKVGKNHEKRILIGLGILVCIGVTETVSKVIDISKSIQAARKDTDLEIIESLNNIANSIERLDITMSTKIEKYEQVKLNLE